jgi:hypothetical protein
MEFRAYYQVPKGKKILPSECDTFLDGSKYLESPDVGFNLWCGTVG